MLSQNVQVSCASVRPYARWTAQERAQLENLAQIHQKSGRVDWKAVSEALETKNARQCYDQYSMADRRIAEHEGKHIWTDEEEHILASAFMKNKYEWEYIQEQYFPKLSIIQLKNKVNSLKHRRPEIFSSHQRMHHHNTYDNCSSSQGSEQDCSSEDLIQKLQMLLGQVSQ